MIAQASHPQRLSLNRSQILGKACIYGLSRGFVFVSGAQMELCFFTRLFSWDSSAAGKSREEFVTIFEVFCIA